MHRKQNRTSMGEKTMKLKIGDKVVTDMGTGFAETSWPIRLDGHDRLWSMLNFRYIEVVNGVGVNDRPIR